MKESPSLLLDTGPIIRLAELNVWDRFLEFYDVIVSDAVIDEARYAFIGETKVPIDLLRQARESRIRIIEASLSEVASFRSLFKKQYQDILDPGEAELLTWLYKSAETSRVCSADSAVFRVLGLLDRSASGLSLEEALESTDLPKLVDWAKITRTCLDWKYTRQFRDEYTRKGEDDRRRGLGLE